MSYMLDSISRLSAEIASLTAQLAEANAEIERLKEWKQLGGEYADCLQKLCMDRLYNVCKPVSHKWPGKPHVETIVEGVEFLLSEIERLRKIEAAAKFAREQWGKRDCFLLPLEKQALTQLDEALSGDGGKA